MARKKEEVVEEIDEQPETPTADDAPETSQPPVEETSPGQAAFAFREFLKSKGVNGVDNFETDEDAASRMLEDYARISNERQQAEQQWQHRYSTVESQLKQLQRAQQEAEARAKQEQQAAKKDFEWNRKLPEYNPAWRQFIGTDGRAIEGADPTLPLKVHEYTQTLQQEIDQFLRKPHEYLNPVFDHREQRLMEKLEERFAALEKNTISKVDEAAYLERLTQLAYDQNGQITPYGQAYIDAVAQFRDGAPKELHGSKAERQYGQMAMQLVGAMSRVNQAPPDDGADKRRQFNNKHNRQPGRAGAIRDNAQPSYDSTKPGSSKAWLSQLFADLPDGAAV